MCESPYTLFQLVVGRKYRNLCFVIPTTTIPTREGLDAQPSRTTQIEVDGLMNQGGAETQSKTIGYALDDCPRLARDVESTNGEGMSAAAIVCSTPTRNAHQTIWWLTSKCVTVQPNNVQTRADA